MPTSSEFQSHANDPWDHNEYIRQGYTQSQAFDLSRRAVRASRAARTDAYLFRVEQRTFSAPRIWRDIRVLSNITFHKFHKVLQIAFGWEDRHLYKFHVYAPGGGRNHDSDYDEDDERELLETISDVESIQDSRDMRYHMEQQGVPTTTENLITSQARLKRIFGPECGRTDVVYEYDNGDGWEHTIEFLGVAASDLHERFFNQGVKAGQHSFCLQGAGHGSLEDCGGLMGWEEHKWDALQHGSLDLWDWDIVAVNRRLDHMLVSLSPTLEQRLMREILSEAAWEETQAAGDVEQIARMQRFAEDPEAVSRAREESRGAGYV